MSWLSILGELDSQATHSWLYLGLLLALLTAFFVVLVWGLVRQQQRLAEHYKYTRDNIDRHRAHADRAEEHFARVEAMLERIALALEERNQVR